MFDSSVVDGLRDKYFIGVKVLVWVVERVVLFRLSVAREAVRITRASTSYANGFVSQWNCRR